MTIDLRDKMIAKSPFRTGKPPKSYRKIEKIQKKINECLISPQDILPPRDGTKIVVFADHMQTERIIVASWQNMPGFPEGVWMDDRGWFFDYKYIKYWMPLPQEPNEPV